MLTKEEAELDALMQEEIGSLFKTHTYGYPSFTEGTVEVEVILLKDFAGLERTLKAGTALSFTAYTTSGFKSEKLNHVEVPTGMVFTPKHTEDCRHGTWLPSFSCNYYADVIILEGETYICTAKSNYPVLGFNGEVYKCYVARGGETPEELAFSLLHELVNMPDGAYEDYRYSSDYED